MRNGRSGDGPLEDVECAEAGGIGEGLGLADPRAGPDGFEVTEVGPLGPGAAALGHQLVDAVGGEELGLRPGLPVVDRG